MNDKSSILPNYKCCLVVQRTTQQSYLVTPSPLKSFKWPWPIASYCSFKLNYRFSRPTAPQSCMWTEINFALPSDWFIFENKGYDVD